eukprot:PhF_6_TR23814/c4_g1_i2/m.33353
MISLLCQKPTIAAVSSLSASIALLPHDCIVEIMQFTNVQSKQSMFLVCRRWYHAVDRLLLLGDTFYNFPEMFVDDIIRRHQIPACVSRSMSTLQDDVRWGKVDVMVLKVQDRLQGVEHFPPSLKSLCLRESTQITDKCVAYLSNPHQSMLTSLTSLDLCGCEKITDTGLAHLSMLTSLTSLNVCCCKLIT